jgi:hypothetical protein
MWVSAGKAHPHRLVVVAHTAGAKAADLFAKL